MSQPCGAGLTPSPTPEQWGSQEEKEVGQVNSVQPLLFLIATPEGGGAGERQLQVGHR